MIMQDDNHPKDDDEDDLDLDLDGDDLDDFDDDSWDDLDVDFEDDGEAVPEKKTKPGAPATGVTAGQKTFVQKYFMFIVGAVVITFAGLFFLGQGGGSSNSNQPQGALPPMADTQIPMADDTLSLGDEQENLPPMPASMQADADMIDLSEPAPQEAPVAFEEEQPLTPLPAEEKDETKTVDLADLEDSLGTPYEVRKAVPVEGIDIEDIDDATPMAESGINSFVVDPVDPIAPLPMDDQTPQLPEDMGADAFASPIELAPAPSSVVDNPVDNSAAMAEKAMIEQDVEKLENQKSELAAQNSELESSIQTAKAEIKTLEDRLAALEKDIKAKEAKSAALSEDIQSLEDKPAAAPKKEPAASAPAPAPKPAAAKPTPKVIDWVLRAAQPGRASIAKKGSNDLKLIEVGESVPGLGRITSIQIENDLWVVRGTQGSLSQ